MQTGARPPALLVDIGSGQGYLCRALSFKLTCSMCCCFLFFAVLIPSFYPLSSPIAIRGLVDVIGVEQDRNNIQEAKRLDAQVKKELEFNMRRQDKSGELPSVSTGVRSLHEERRGEERGGETRGGAERWPQEAESSHLFEQANIAYLQHRIQWKGGGVVAALREYFRSSAKGEEGKLEYQMQDSRSKQLKEDNKDQTVQVGYKGGIRDPDMGIDNFGLICLHACGDLVPNMLEYFANTQRCCYLFAVSCWYRPPT
eukprot:766546-Hanusia_phi.AAC.3